MKKRGISPLIATMLIVGLVFVLAVVINVFIRGVAEEQSEDIEFNYKLSSFCRDNTQLELVDICDNGNEFEIELENKGTYEIENITFVVWINQNNEITKEDKSIGKFGKTKFLANYPVYSSGDILEIEYIKHLVIEGKIGNCKPGKIEAIADKINAC